MKGSFMNIVEAFKTRICKISALDVQFFNGCWLSLVPDNGMYFAATPYGVDHFFAEGRLENTLKEWLDYWDDDRDETGQLIERISAIS